jgi:hypothetical protein
MLVRLLMARIDCDVLAFSLDVDCICFICVLRSGRV